MEHINYFKLQAKNLFKDYKTRYFNEKTRLYDYKPKYFDIDEIFISFDYYDNDEDFSFTLMNAQHVIANLVGYNKWNDLLKASEDELELAHLLFDNAHKLSLGDWQFYIYDVEQTNRVVFDARSKIDILEQVFLSTDSHRSIECPLRLDLRDLWNTPPADLEIEEHPKPVYLYEELSGLERTEALQKQGNKNPEDIVECIHCGERYKYKEVKVVRLIPQNQDYIPNDNVMIVCKNHPQCNGFSFDLIKVK